MAGNFFRGTSVEQDGRFGKSDERLMAKMSKAGKFSPILDTKVNMKKVNLEFMSKWITAKIIQVVGFEDDIVINLIVNMLQGETVDPKKMQLDVTGFLEKQAQAFVEELWTHLVDAQNQQSGIPSIFIQKKKEEILNREQSKHSTLHTTSTAKPESNTVTEMANKSAYVEATIERSRGRTNRGRSDSPLRNHSSANKHRDEDRDHRDRHRSDHNRRSCRDDSRNRDRRRDDSRDRHHSRRDDSDRHHRHHSTDRHRSSRDDEDQDRKRHRAASDEVDRTERGTRDRRSRHADSDDDDEGHRRHRDSKHSRHRRSHRSRSNSHDIRKATGNGEGKTTTGSAAIDQDTRRPRSDSSSSSSGDSVVAL